LKLIGSPLQYFEYEKIPQDIRQIKPSDYLRRILMRPGRPGENGKVAGNGLGMIAMIGQVVSQWARGI
jgi:hypothetical protein